MRNEGQWRVWPSIRPSKIMEPAETSQHRRLYRWFYDKIHSRHYDLCLNWVLIPCGGERKFRAVMLEPVRFSTGERILDMCCGTGGCTFAIRERAGEEAEIIGCDLSHGQIRSAERKNRFENVSFFVADACRTGLPGSHFDKVFIPHALHEMLRPLRLAVLAEARRLTKPGGSVIVLELARPPRLPERLLQGLWLGYWIPWPINFENPTRKEMLRYGLANELREVGLKEVTTTHKHRGWTQVAIGSR